MSSAADEPIAYHLVPAEVWEAAPSDEPFRAASLAAEGFVHLTGRMVDLVDVGNRYYRDDPRPYVVLTVAHRWVTAPWRHDGDDRYPHVYGPLDRRAITEVRPIERMADGTFLPVVRPDTRVKPAVDALLALLLDAEVRFIVVGSAGAALLGADIEPGDLDICPASSTDNLERLAVVLEQLGALPRIGVPGWVTEEDRASYRPQPEVGSLDFLFETSLGDLDLVFEPLGPEGSGRFDFAALAVDAVHVDVNGRPVAVASPAHLVASKLAARRPGDVRSRGELERLVREHGGGG